MKGHTKNFIKVLSQLDALLVGVEVGVWRGDNAFQLLRRFPSLHLHLVDHYESEDKKLVYEGDVEKEALNTLKPFKSRCTWWRMSSEDAAKAIKCLFDFVIIDADHRYEAVRYDIDLWFPMVRKGGIFCGDDYSGHFKGLKKAVNERFGNEVNVDGRVWWIVI